MSKRDEPQELAPISDAEVALAIIHHLDTGELLWKTRDEGLIPLKMMEDSHLRNAALMLMGMGYQQYAAPDHIKIRWLSIFRLEWERRMRERATSFKKNR